MGYGRSALNCKWLWEKSTLCNVFLRECVCECVHACVSACVCVYVGRGDRKKEGGKEQGRREGRGMEGWGREFKSFREEQSVR